VHARLCNGAAASLPLKLLQTYLESCANIVQAVVSARLPAPSSSRPPSCRHVARPVCLRNPCKSTLAHDAVAAVVLHKHHPIICVGVGLIQFVYGSHSRMAVYFPVAPWTKSMLAAIFVGFFKAKGFVGQNVSEFKGFVGQNVSELIFCQRTVGFCEFSQPRHKGSLKQFSQCAT